MSDGPPPSLVARLDLAAPGHRVLICSPGRQRPDWVPLDARCLIADPDDPARLHRELAGLGRQDLIVDVARGADATQRLRREITSLRAGGIVVMALPTAPANRRRVERLLADLAQIQADGVVPPAVYGDVRPRRERHRHGLAATVATPEAVEGHALLRCVREVSTTVGEDDIDAVLAARPQLGSTLPFGHDPADGAPALRLRRFDGAVLSPRSVVTTDDLVLPATYRDPIADRLKTPHVADWTEHAAWVRHGEPEHLPGAWLLLDNVMRGHFGHAITEQAGLTWAWRRVRELEPDAGVVATNGGVPWAGWESELLESWGVPADRLRLVDGAARLDRLYAATPAYVIGRAIHPIMADVYARAAARLVGPTQPEATVSRLVFVTRDDAKRACRNREAVEVLARGLGFEIMRPERLPLPRQIALFAGARVIAGLAGSGMFQLVHARPGTPLVVVSSDRYHAWNEQALARLRGHPLQLIRGSTSEPELGVSPMHTPFEVDLGLLESALRQAIAQASSQGADTGK